MTREDQLNFITKEYEKKLSELMPEEEPWAYVGEVARRAFRVEIDGMADGEFKQFVLANYNKIVGEET